MPTSSTSASYAALFPFLQPTVFPDESLFNGLGHTQMDLLVSTESTCALCDNAAWSLPATLAFVTLALWQSLPSRHDWALSEGKPVAIIVVLASI